jgi:sporulation protein YlmC with PRC-barrel domain
MSELIGMDVRNAKGENLGDVTDVVVDVETGRVAYAVVGIGGFLGIGEKLSAFPMGAFKLTQARPRSGSTASGDRAIDNDGVKGDRGPIGSDGTSATANRMLPGRGVAVMHLVLDADPQRLKRAPNFDTKAWPDWNDPKYRGEVDRAAGTASTAKAGRMLRGSQLLDADIRDANSKNVGEIEDLVMDVRTGAIRYAVVDFDRALTPDDKLVAVPMKALRPSGEKGELVFTGDRSQLERAPAFEKGKWPDLTVGAFRGEVDRSMSSWRVESTNAACGTTPGTGMTGATTDRSRASTAARSGASGGGTTDPGAAGAPTGAPGSPGAAGATGR